MSKNKKQFCIVEHIWRAGRWALGLTVIILWGAPTEVYFAYIALGTYEQLHGTVCRLIEKALNWNEQHTDWD